MIGLLPERCFAEKKQKYFSEKIILFFFPEENGTDVLGDGTECLHTDSSSQLVQPLFLPCDGIEQLASHVYQVPMQDEENLSQGFLRRTRQKFQTHEQASTSLFHEFLERVP